MSVSPPREAVLSTWASINSSIASINVRFASINDSAACRNGGKPAPWRASHLGESTCCVSLGQTARNQRQIAATSAQITQSIARMIHELVSS
eukprot:84815-Rhodomonas_salina.5